MLTIIEQETLTLVKKVCIALLDRLDKRDWENRRYEIAKSVLNQYIGTPESEAATHAVKYADALIKELKK